MSQNRLRNVIRADKFFSPYHLRLDRPWLGALEVGNMHKREILDKLRRNTYNKGKIFVLHFDAVPND